MNNTSMTIRTDKAIKQQAQMIFSESFALSSLKGVSLPSSSAPKSSVSKSGSDSYCQAMVNAENDVDVYGPYDSVEDLMEALNA